MNKTLIVLVLLPLLSGCKNQEPEATWQSSARSAVECHYDHSNMPCLVIDQLRTSGTLYEEGKEPIQVRVLWREKDGTWRFADDLHTS